MNKTQQIIELLKQGKKFEYISLVVSCSKGTITDIVRRHPELSRRKQFDWDEVDKFYVDQGFMKTLDKYKLKSYTLTNAIINGKLKSERIENALQGPRETEGLSEKMD